MTTQKQQRPDEYVDGWGELIRAHRIFIGVSQRTMADRLGMSERSLSDIEVGRRSCPPGLLDTVTRVVDEFLADVEKVSTYAQGRDSPVALTISSDPRKEWERTVVGAAAVETGTIMPRLIGE